MPAARSVGVARAPSRLLEFVLDFTSTLDRSAPRKGTVAQSWLCKISCFFCSCSCLSFLFFCTMSAKAAEM